MSQSIQTVVVDEGSSQVKVAWIANGKIETALLPVRGKYGVDEDHDGNILPCVYKVEGQKITVDRRIPDPISTKHEHYQLDPLNRVMVHEALRLAGFGGIKVNLIATLPAEQYFEGKHVREAKKEHLQKPVTNLGGAELAIINDVKVAPEGVMAWNSLCLDDNGQFLDRYEDVEKVMMIDIGGTTTDITIVHNDNHVEDKRSVDIGVFDIAAELNERIRKSPDIDGSRPSAAALDTALRTKIFRKKTDVSELVDESVNVVAGKILNEMRNRLSDPGDLDYICYVGGGSHLLKDALSRVYRGNTIDHPNPEFAVAFGILKGVMEAQQETTA